MRYILVANNRNLTDITIKKIGIIDTDIVVLFNYMYPVFYFPSISSAKKIAFLRKRSKNFGDPSNSYAGIDLVSNYSDKFEKIFIYPSPDTIKSSSTREFCLNSILYYGLDKTKKLWKIQNNFKKKYGFNSEKGLSSGLIMYLYLQEIKEPIDQIILVGFTHNVAKQFHDPDMEKIFFEKELNSNKFIQILS